MTDISNDCWLTLLALKILKLKFPNHEVEWRMAGMKAKQWLKGKGVPDWKERLAKININLI